MSDVRFVTTGHVTRQRGGPLSITVLTDSDLQVTDVLGNTEGIARQLRAGTPPSVVIEQLSSFRKSTTSIPIDCIRSLHWLKRQTGLRIDYDDERGHNRRKTTYIQTDADRHQLIDRLEQGIGHQFQRREEPAGFWKLAGSQMLGALLSVVGTIVFQLLWDPQLLARLKHGWIVLKLGRVGCGLVGLCFFLGCLVAAWRRVHPRPVEHHCIV